VLLVVIVVTWVELAILDVETGDLNFSTIVLYKVLHALLVVHTSISLDSLNFVIALVIFELVTHIFTVIVVIQLFGDLKFTSRLNQHGFSQFSLLLERCHVY
jgi:hypothetical protein